MIANWIKEWAIVISGGATFLLALGAFWAIRQTRSIQKAEKRERLLNEIIEWATDIVNYILESDVFDIVTFRQGLYPDNTFEELFYEVKNLRIARAKSTKILTIAHQVDQALNEKIEEKIQTLVNELRVQIGCLRNTEETPKVAPWAPWVKT